MYINQIDNLFDGLLNKFNEYLLKHKSFEQLTSDNNFVKYQNNILKYIDEFTKSITEKQILDIVKEILYRINRKYNQKILCFLYLFRYWLLL
jgi:hypothetical protein